MAKPKPLTAGTEMARGRMVYVQRVCSCVNGDLYGTHTAWIDCPRCFGARTVVVPEVEPEPDCPSPPEDRLEDLAVFKAAYGLLDCVSTNDGVTTAVGSIPALYRHIEDLRRAMYAAGRWDHPRSFVRTGEKEE